MKKKKITLLAAVLATAAMFTGCTIEDEYVPVDSVANEIPDIDNIILSLKETVDRHGFVSYVWQAENEGC